ncbi:transglutaminase family protein [Pseudorhodobacter wandonensis]|uniref:transglutaminase family protein n=1 Tax=Pseudorhodobacter wandonensis TaxID=1120568 RepID=UPI00067B095D|nr:transglutaminase family protein [Pseudorhodobacter wandonensis]
MLYDIRLTLTHTYAQPAGNSRHLLRLLPQTLARQTVTVHQITAMPLPDTRHDRFDFFGTAVTALTHSDPHPDMSITMTCRVAMAQPLPWNDRSVSLGNLQTQIRNCKDLSPASPVHFLGPSYRLKPDSDIAAFAQSVTQNITGPETGVAQTIIRLGKALHDEMRFDAKATTVDTTAAQAFAQRSGVCQDFSHIMIVALRSLGIPAGYVSGYLRTLPPPGQPRLVGVDAMHAWVKAWCGKEMGWIEYDPTNATLAGTDHITVGFGRDYADVSPILGHLRSSGAPIAEQTVDVAPID